MFKVFVTYICILFVLLSSSNIYAQSCSDNIKNGDELKIDCGGSNCPPCLNVVYAGVCDSEIGSYSLNLYFPHDPTGIYYIQGDINYQDYNPGIDFNPLSIQYSDGSSVNINITKYNEDGDVIGQTKIKDGYLACTKLSEEFECPPSSELTVDYTMFGCNEVDQTYFLQLTINNGIAPFQITNDTLENLYYDAEINDEIVNIGPLSNGQVFPISVIDSDGCTVDLMFYNDFENCEILWNIASIDEPQLQDTNLNLSVNYAQNTITILELDSKILKYEIYDINGRRIAASAVSASQTESYEIPYPERFNGVAILVLHTNNGIYRSKFLAY